MTLPAGVTDPMQRTFSNFVDSMVRFTPPERAEILKWVGDCYCIKCGYPAPPKGERCFCAEVADGGV